MFVEASSRPESSLITLHSGTERCVGKINASLQRLSLSADWATRGISNAKSKVSSWAIPDAERQTDRGRERDRLPNKVTSDLSLSSSSRSLTRSAPADVCRPVWVCPGRWVCSHTNFLCECIHATSAVCVQPLCLLYLWENFHRLVFFFLMSVVTQARTV